MGEVWEKLGMGRAISKPPNPLPSYRLLGGAIPMDM